jgi:DNA adenine methylase
LNANRQAKTGRLGPAAQPFLRPFLKWAGGKTQLLPQFEQYYPREKIERYIEPFLGSGAVFFHVKSRLHPKTAILCDNNDELIETFKAVQTHVEDVIRALRTHKRKHGPEYFREMRTRPFKSATERAARLIYLNKTCFNGLYRVNSRGVFNVPMGRYHKPAILDEDGLREANRQLQDVQIMKRDFHELPDLAERGDFIYLDPPYRPVSSTSYFTSYTRDPFGDREQRDLSDVYGQLCEAGCLVMLSNSDNPFIRKLYRRFKDVHIHTVSARRNINSRAERRGPINELVIVNYPTRRK